MYVCMYVYIYIYIYSTIGRRKGGPREESGETARLGARPPFLTSPQQRQQIFSGILRQHLISSGILQRIVTCPVDFHWNFPVDFQWHFPTTPR